MLYFTSKMLINEQKMWKMINEVQKRHQNWHFFRLESLTINGIPDVFGCIDGHSFWVELKASKVKNKGISKYQINWHLNHKNSGGYSFILNHHETLRELEILEVHEPRTIKKLKSYPLPGPCTMKQYETILETILMNHKKGPRNNARSILPNEPF